MARIPDRLKNELDKTTQRREGDASNNVFDFIVTVKSVDELIGLIRTEYPDLSESDLINRVKMLDIPGGQLAEYSENNGLRYQIVDSGLAMQGNAPEQRSCVS